MKMDRKRIMRRARKIIYVLEYSIADVLKDCINCAAFDYFSRFAGVDFGILRLAIISSAYCATTLNCYRGHVTVDDQ